MSDPSRIRRRRFRWQISLRTFLIVSLLLCPLTIFLYSEYREFRAHRQEIERRISEGAIVIYEYQVDENGYYIANAPPPLKPGFFLKMHCHSNSDGFVTRLLANPKVTVKTQVALTNAYGQTDLSFFSDKDFVTDLDLGKFGRLTRLDGIEKLKSLATVKFGRPIGHSYLEDISALGKCPGLKRIEFSEEVSESVYNRMRQERARVASELRAEGAENAERIRAEADRERTVILAEAYRDAEKVRGQGDATAADLYARAFGKDEEFYSFYRSIQAYRRSVGTGNDILVLDSDSDFLRYLNASGQ